MAQLRYVSHSEVGLVRKNNQDSGFASPRLLVVADGMGGAAAGDLASAVAIDTLKNIAGVGDPLGRIRTDGQSAGEKDESRPDEGGPSGPDQADENPPARAGSPSDQSTPAPPTGAQPTAGQPATDQPAEGPKPATGQDMLEVLAGAIHQANDRIADLVEADFSLDGMGTTVTGMMFDGTELGLAHIGDSRAYLLRDGILERLTHDHSWVQSLVDEGKITPDEAAFHPHRSLLLKVLNGQSANDPDLTMVTLADGDRLMLCSDGVCGLLDDDIIAAALQLDTPQDAIDELVSESLAEGGIDNITVIVADVVSDDAAAADAGRSTVEILGAAAEREIPALVRSTGGRSEPVEDTVIRPRAELAAAVSHAGAGRSSTPTTPTDDEARYNPVPPKRYRFVRSTVLLVSLALVIGVGLATAYAWTRTQFYVGADKDQVAIYQGLSEHLPGLQLSTVYELQPLVVADLPPYYQDQVRANIEVASLDSARQTVAELTETARRCATAPKPSPSPTPTPTAAGPRNPDPTASTGPGSAVPTSTGAGPSVSPTGPATTPSSAASPAEC